MLEAEQANAVILGSTTAAAYSWAAINDLAASGGVGAQAGPSEAFSTNLEPNGPRLDYQVHLMPGTYTIYMRGRAPAGAPVGNSDSLHVAIDNTLLTNISGEGLNGFGPSGYSWQTRSNANTPTTFVASIEHDYLLSIFMREAGITVDRVMLIQEGTPFTEGSTELGPPESPCWP